jgi:hypothetical protein
MTSTKIYSYGAWEPTEGLDLVRRQLSLAHRYYNALVAIERVRHERTHEALLRASPDVARLDGEARALTDKIEALYTRLNEERARARRRVSSESIVAEIRALKAERSATWKTSKPIRAAAYRLPEFLAAREAVDARRNERVRRFRAAISSLGLYWGTYLTTEESVDQARKKSQARGEAPKFRRWTGEGRVAVQLQKGLAVPVLMAATDKRLRVETRTRPDAVVGSGTLRPSTLRRGQAGQLYPVRRPMPSWRPCSLRALPHSPHFRSAVLAGLLPGPTRKACKKSPAAATRLRSCRSLSHLRHLGCRVPESMTCAHPRHPSTCVRRPFPRACSAQPRHRGAKSEKSSFRRPHSQQRFFFVQGLLLIFVLTMGESPPRVGPFGLAPPVPLGCLPAGA